MAVRAVLIEHTDQNTMRATWVGLLNGDTGDPVRMPSGSDKCVDMRGTYGAGGSISLKGTNKDAIDSVNDKILTAGEGGANPITSTTGVLLEQVQENPLNIYPHVTAGDGTTNLECRVVIKR